MRWQTIRWASVRAGAALCLLYSIACFTSVGWYSTKHHGIELASGEVSIGWWAHDRPWAVFQPQGFEWCLWSGSINWLPRVQAESLERLNVGVPLWMLIVAAAGLAAVAHSRMKPPPFGRCAKCGYLLAGLAGPVCPECGQKSLPSAGPTSAGEGEGQTGK